MNSLDLQTSELHLRLLNEGDADLHRRLFTCPRVMARIAAPMDAAGAARTFERQRMHNARDRPGHRSWAALERASGQPVGIGALHRDRDEADVGIMLLPAAWNSRYSAQMLDALLACAFDRLELARVTATCKTGPNERMALRLMAPHGFTAIAVERPDMRCWAVARPAAVGTAPGVE